MQDEVKKLEKAIAPVVAKEIAIKTDGDMALAADQLTALNRAADRVEEEKKKITAPLNVALKNARALFAPLEDRLENAIGSLRREMTRYQTAAEAKKAKVADRAAAGKIGLDAASRQIDRLGAPDKVAASNGGAVAFVDHPCFEVTDHTKLPREYLVPDEVKIRAAMKAGTELPGVRYWVEKRPKNSR